MPTSSPFSPRCRADLHSHSNISDGVLAPSDVVQRAAQAGVELFSLTDHDEIRGIAQARTAAQALGVAFIAGVEISVTWANHTIHIVGLNIDETNPQLLAGLNNTRQGRTQRAQAIAHDLAKHGIANAYEGAHQFVSNPDLISRSHFARYLVQIKQALNTQDAFNRFLTSGKPGYVAHQWASLENAVSWIKHAGGIAILAHPGRYQLTAISHDALLTDFIRYGGQGIEVLTSSHSLADTERYLHIARQYQLWISCGSDFHDPKEQHTQFGNIFAAIDQLPRDLIPVWTQC